MAITVDTQDLNNFPGIVKRVTVDQSKIIPTGASGDEKYTLVISTTAYSDNTNNTRIQDLYITGMKVGWVKSSGLKGSAGKFMLDSTHNRLKVKVDTTVSGTDGNGFYEIVLDYNTDGTPKTGEDIALDMQNKIRAIQCAPGDIGYQLSYKNVNVEFKESRFWITSGSISDTYTGPYRSSVAAAPASTNDAYSLLGFDGYISSEEIAGTSVSEALITSDYTAGTSTLNISPGTGVVAGDCILITDKTNRDYCPVLGVVNDTVLTVPTSSVNGFDGIKHNYTVASGTKIQVLREQDPDSVPTYYCDNVDALIRFGIKNIVNQIDYSS